MLIYFLNYIILILMGIILLKRGDKRRKLAFCSIAVLQWIFLSGLRHISIGADTWQYYNGHFAKNLNKSWAECLNSLILWLHGGDAEEPAFMFLQKLFQLFSKNYQSFLVFVAILFMIPLGIWIYKHSPRPLISFAIYFCLFSSFFSITGISQTLATSLAVFGGYKYISDRKLLNFLAITIVAVFMHKSAFCILLLYFIGTIELNHFYMLCIWVIFAVEMILKDIVMYYVANISGYTLFASATEGAPYNFSVVYSIVAFACMWRYPELKKQGKECKIWTNAIMIGLLILPLVFVNATAMRAVQYFSIYLILNIPALLDTFERRESYLVEAFAMLCLGILFFHNKPQYLFFWQ